MFQMYACCQECVLPGWWPCHAPCSKRTFPTSCYCVKSHGLQWRVRHLSAEQWHSYCLFFAVPDKLRIFAHGLSDCTYAIQNYLIFGRQRSPFLLFVLLVDVFPPEEVQTFLKRSVKVVCTSSGGMVIYTKTVHFYLECLPSLSTDNLPWAGKWCWNKLHRDTVFPYIIKMNILAWKAERIINKRCGILYG